MENWNFRSINGKQEFEGQFLGADKLRFMTELSHFANSIKKLNIN